MTEDRLPAAYRVADEAARGEGAAELPRVVFFEVTNRCNLLCATCPRTFVEYEAPHDMTLAELTAAAAQFPSLERAVLHGIGEPLLNPELGAMIRHLKGRGAAVLFNSNATLLTPAWQETLAESGLDEYRISLDGADGEMYARIRGRRMFDTVAANLRGMVATQQRLGLATPRLSIWCMGMKENIEQLPALVRLAADIGIPEVYVQRLTYAVAPEDRQGLGQAEQALFGGMAAWEGEIVAESEALAERLGVRLAASGATDPGHSLSAAQAAERLPWRACLRPWTSAYITANGNALPCCISPFATRCYDELILGNVWQRDFSEIWNDAPYRAWRRALLSAEPHAACSGCGVYWSL